MYMKRIIHDLDIAHNHNGQGETFGVTYMMDGENIEELILGIQKMTIVKRKMLCLHLRTIQKL